MIQYRKLSAYLIVLFAHHTIVQVTNGIYEMMKFYIFSCVVRRLSWDTWNNAKAYSSPSAAINEKRKRNITWYNPPFDMRVKTNLGKKFLRIGYECFPRGHALRPIFNRYTLKLSYSCMSNAKSTIDAHNKHLLKQINSGESISGASLCNCRKKEDCPLENQCLTRGIVYQANVTIEQGSEFYVG